MAGMGSIYTGLSGLQASQAGINVTSHNLANIYTKGYVRQSVVYHDYSYANVGVSSTSKMQVGKGVFAAETSRIRDFFLDRAYRKEVGRQGFYEARASTVAEIETILGEMEGVKFQDTLDDLWKAVSEIAKDPVDVVNRSALVMRAEAFLNRSQSIYEELTNYQKILDEAVKNVVNRINELGDTIHTLNKRISEVENSSVENANDLRDLRDNALDELGRLVKITYEEQMDSTVLVKVENMHFVAEDGCYHMGVAQLDADKGSTYLSAVWPMFGNMEVFNLEVEISVAQDNDIGFLKGLLLSRGDYVATYKDVPDKIYDKPNEASYDLTDPAQKAAYDEALENYEKYVRYVKQVEPCEIMKVQALFDKLINQMIEDINEVFSPTVNMTVPAGTTIDYYTYDEDGGIIVDGAGNPVMRSVLITDNTVLRVLDAENCSTDDHGNMPPEELFIRNNTSRYIVAEIGGQQYYIYNETNKIGYESLYTLNNIKMNPEIVDDYSRLPFTKQDGTPDHAKGDELLSLWEKKGMNLDCFSLTVKNYNEFYQQFVDVIANMGKLYNDMTDYQGFVVHDVDRNRQQVTAVSSEEELANMIKFKAAYDAASRYVNVVSEMLEHIIMRLGR